MKIKEIEKMTVAYLDNDKPIFARVDYSDGTHEVITSDDIDRIMQLKKSLSAQQTEALDKEIKDRINE